MSASTTCSHSAATTVKPVSAHRKSLVETIEPLIERGVVTCLADLAPAPLDWQPFIGPAGALDLFLDLPRHGEIILTAAVPSLTREQTFATIELAPEEALALGRALVRAAHHQLRLKPKADAA